MQALIPVRFGAFQKFQEGIENLYNSIQSPIPAPEFAQKLKKLQAYIMDNHCTLITPTYEHGRQDFENEQAKSAEQKNRGLLSSLQ